MKVAKKYANGVPYTFDAEGDTVEATMNPDTALNIAQEGKSKGDKIVSGKYIFAAACFDDAPKSIPKTKKELVESAKETLTNKELKEAVKKGKESPEKPHFTKNTTTER